MTLAAGTAPGDDRQKEHIRQLMEEQAPVPEIVVAWYSGEPTLIGLDRFRQYLKESLRIYPLVAVILGAIARLDGTVAASFGDSVDRDLAKVGDHQGIGGPGPLPRAAGR